MAYTAGVVAAGQPGLVSRL